LLLCSRFFHFQFSDPLLIPVRAGILQFEQNLLQPILGVLYFGDNLPPSPGYVPPFAPADGYCERRRSGGAWESGRLEIREWRTCPEPVEGLRDWEIGRLLA
jgi:hypothetical protein